MWFGADILVYSGKYTRQWTLRRGISLEQIVGDSIISSAPENIVGLNIHLETERSDVGIHNTHSRGLEYYIIDELAHKLGIGDILALDLL